MEIHNLRRTGGAGALAAVFDVEVAPSVTLTDWQLRQTAKGLRAYPPNTSNGRPAVILHPTSFSEIGRLAATAFQEGNSRNDRKQ